MSSFLISNVSTGQERDLKPWLLPDDAYVTLENGYIFRGRTQKEAGLLALGPLSRLPESAPGVPVVFPVALAPPLVAGATTTIPISPTVPGMVGVVPGSLRLSLSIGPTLVNDISKNGALTSLGTDPMLAQVDYATGIISIFIPVGSPLAGAVVSVVSVRTFPGTLAPAVGPNRTPCMGIWTRQLDSLNFEQTVFFDQVDSYIFSAAGFNRLGTANWTGGNSNFFWCTNVRNPLVGNTVAANNNFFFATNFNLADPIRYISAPDVWTDFAPAIFPAPPAVPTNFMFQARCIVQFKNRLLFFNTWDGTSRALATNYPNRCRFSWIGDPTDITNGYIQSPAGKGGFVDAAIAEQIVSVAVLKDVIIVKFETVSWRLVYTGNPYQPFEWQKVNQEYGSDSTFSSIQFDDFVLTVGNRAITQDSSVGVQRIDEKIPDEVFEISNDNEGPKRVVGIRDFNKEQVYWTAPIGSSSNAAPTYPNRMINYSYRTGAFGIFKDVLTFLGRFQNQTYYTWGDAAFLWGDNGYTWGSPAQDYGYENIAAGNQQGNIFLLQSQTDNDPTFEISSIVIAGTVATVTIVDHNLDDGDFVKFRNVQGFNYPGSLSPPPLVAGETSFTYDLVTTGTSGPTLSGDLIPGTVVVTYTQTVPALVVTMYDNGSGALVSATAGFTGTIDYGDKEVTVNVPSVPIAPNVSSVVIGYEYSLFNGRIFAALGVTANTFILGYALPNDSLDVYAFPSTAPIDPFTFGQLGYLTDFTMETKQFNPFAGKDTAIQMPWSDIYLDSTDAGEVAFEVRADDFALTSNPPINTYTGDQWTLKTSGGNKLRYWQRIFTNTRGEFVQISFSMSNRQMMLGKSFYRFVLHGLLLNMQPSGRLIRSRYDI